LSMMLLVAYLKEPVISKEIKNLTMNFGPQHPAAHGVLRLVLELSGEVSLVSLEKQHSTKGRSKCGPSYRTPSSWNGKVDGIQNLHPGAGPISACS
jgi:hypothetical protein